MIRALTILVISLFTNLAEADQVVESFESRLVIDSSTAVFNQELGVLHPNLQVINYGGGAQVSNFSVGDGRHGSFDSSTYSQFSANGDISGNIIRFDTDEYPVLQVTSFTLDAGWVIEPVGSNPLIIYSLSDVIINGEIHCHGEDGANAVNATPGTGGVGRCGGGNGGNGGLPSTDGTDGENVDALVTGGQAGNWTGGVAVSGGGGGSWNTTSLAGDGTNFSGAGGQGGSSQSEPDFSTIAGGAGGGGGSGTNTEAGAGGGGGGGAVIIHAVGDLTLGVAGRIRLNGGDGGDSNVAGGAGGGGAGGSVKLFSGARLSILNLIGSGAAEANAGTGGTNTGADLGGNGGSGRTWSAAVTYTFSGTVSPAEEFPFAPGDVSYVGTAGIFESKSYDLENTKLEIDSITTTPVSSDFVVEAAGSDDDFVDDDTGWTTDLSLLTNKRYLKLKVTITNTSGNNPTFLESLNINFTPINIEQFDFVATGCGSIQTPPTTPSSKPLLLLLLLLPFLSLLILRTKTQPTNT